MKNKFLKNGIVHERVSEKQIFVEVNCVSQPARWPPMTASIHTHTLPHCT